MNRVYGRSADIGRQQNHQRLDLRHEFAEAGPRDEHVQGWRYQLSVFANVVADLVNARAVETVDAWFAVWSDASEDGP